MGGFLKTMSPVAMVASQGPKVLSPVAMAVDSAKDDKEKRKDKQRGGGEAGKTLLSNA